MTQDYLPHPYFQTMGGQTPHYHGSGTRETLLCSRGCVNGITPTVQPWGSGLGIHWSYDELCSWNSSLRVLPSIVRLRLGLQEAGLSELHRGKLRPLNAVRPRSLESSLLWHPNFEAVGFLFQCIPCNECPSHREIISQNSISHVPPFCLHFCIHSMYMDDPNVAGKVTPQLQSQKILAAAPYLLYPSELPLPGSMQTGTFQHS